VVTIDPLVPGAQIAVLVVRLQLLNWLLLNLALPRPAGTVRGAQDPLPAQRIQPSVRVLTRVERG